MIFCAIFFFFFLSKINYEYKHIKRFFPRRSLYDEYMTKSRKCQEFGPVKLCMFFNVYYLIFFFDFFIRKYSQRFFDMFCLSRPVSLYGPLVWTLLSEWHLKGDDLFPFSICRLVKLTRIRGKSYFWNHVSDDFYKIVNFGIRGWGKKRKL